MESKPLSKKVIRSGIWVFTLRIISWVIIFVRTIILARLLLPEDFGLLGVAMLAIATLETFSQTGIQATLIHKKDNIESSLDTAWTVSVIRGIMLFIILFCSAPLIAAFFNSPQAISIIKVLAINTLLSGFRNIGILFFQKELDFKKQFIYELSASLVDLAISIFLAFLLRNVWALVWGGLIANLVRLFMSYMLQPYRPHARLDKIVLLELFGFGKWVFGSSILLFLLIQGDDIFVGKMLGITALGFYQMAYLISNLPATGITHVISQVTFPAYAKLQDNTSKLKNAYLRVLRITAFLSFPAAGLIFVLSPDFTKLFLGDKWVPIVTATQVLCIFGLTRSIGATIGPILYGLGKPKIQTLLSAIQLTILIAIIYPLTIHWGLLGISVAVVIPNIVALILIAKILNILIDLGYMDFLQNTIAPATGVFMMVLFSLFRNHLLTFTNNYFNFFTLMAICLSIYIIIVYLWDKRTGNKMWNELQAVFRNIGWVK